MCRNKLFKFLRGNIPVRRGGRIFQDSRCIVSPKVESPLESLQGIGFCYCLLRMFAMSAEVCNPMFQLCIPRTCQSPLNRVVPFGIVGQIRIVCFFRPLSKLSSCRGQVRYSIWTDLQAVSPHGQPRSRLVFFHLPIGKSRLDSTLQRAAFLLSGPNSIVESNQSEAPRRVTTSLLNGVEYRGCQED